MYHEPKARIIAVASGLAALLGTAPAAARSGGLNVADCSGCHALPGFAGTITLTPEGPLPPGATTDLLLTVYDAEMVETGMYLKNVGGQGEVAAGAGLRLFSAGELVHAQPRKASDGASQFQFSFTTPAQAGDVQFEVAVVAANDDGTFGGDRAAQARFSRVWGCGDGITLYEDLDGDGYGLEDSTSTGCEARSGWAALSGDCNSVWASIYPGAPEQPNGKDDDCDGEIDNGIEFSLLFPDRDGDGFGTTAGGPIESVTAREGYVPNSDDCDDTQPAAFPGGEEVCDGFDNDCDGTVDEDTYKVCGVGRCSRLLYLCDRECVPGEPVPETCNGLDDDCDGEVDEGELCGAGQSCDGECVESAGPTASGDPSDAAATPPAVDGDGGPSSGGELPLSVRGDDAATPGGAPAAAVDMSEGRAPVSPGLPSDEAVADGGVSPAAPATDGGGSCQFVVGSPGRSGIPGALLFGLAVFGFLRPRSQAQAARGPAQAPRRRL